LIGATVLLFAATVNALERGPLVSVEIVQNGRMRRPFRAESKAK
jgi:hypothetical protein